MALIFEAFTDEELNLISGSTSPTDITPHRGQYVKLSIYDMLDSSDYPSKDSIVHKIIYKLDEFTNHNNREWCEMKVLQTFNKFEFFLFGMRECQVDYFGPLNMIYDYFINELLNEF